jgi:hypothetical protein
MVRYSTVKDGNLFTHKPYLFYKLVKHEDVNDRWYTLGDVRYQSVTSFIDQNWDKSFLDDWRKRIGEQMAQHVTETAAERGKQLHGIVDTYLNNGEPFLPDPYQRVLFNKVRPHLDRINNIRLIEKPVYSEVLRLAGTPDCIAEYNGILSILDFKTSTKVKKMKYIVSYFLQCGFYGMMAGELYGETAKRAIIVMATEDKPTAQVFVLPMTMCLEMVAGFVADPVEFQKKMKSLQRSHGNTSPP